jgi:hypothetical protein
MPLLYGKGERTRSVVRRVRPGEPIGSANDARKFRKKLEGWLHLVGAMWPDWPAAIDPSGTGLYADRAVAVLSS